MLVFTSANSLLLKFTEFQKCVLDFVYVERVFVEIGINSVPKQLTYIHPHLDTIRLRTALDMLRLNHGLLDPHMEGVLLEGNDRLSLREALTSGDKERLSVALAELEALQPDDLEAGYAQAFLNLFVLKDDIEISIVHGGPPDTAGEDSTVSTNLDFSKLEVDNLSKYLQLTDKISISDKKWKTLLTSCKALLDLRRSLIAEEYETAETILESIANSGMVFDDKVLRSIPAEIYKYKFIVRHRQALNKILSAIPFGAFYVDCDVTTVDGTNLSITLNSVRGKLLFSEDVKRLLRDIEVIINLRNGINAGSWNTVVQYTKELKEAVTENSILDPKYFHPSIASELKAIFNEVSNIEIREQLLTALKSYPLLPIYEVSLTTGIGSSASGQNIDVIDVDLENCSWDGLYAAIVNACSEPLLSAETRYLIHSARIVCALRASAIKVENLFN